MARSGGTLGQSFGDILSANRGTGKGFDLLRLGLALLILISHTSGVIGHSGTTAWLQSLIFGDHHASTGAVASALPTVPASLQTTTHAKDLGLTGLTGPFIRALVPMFFILSGFLVTGSAQRTKSLVRFLGLRILRIVPALFVEVLLSAVILGAVFTTLPLAQYFSHPQFYAYFWNILGIVHFHLPGVFQNSADGVVNANLWTLPFELECYALMSVIILCGLLRYRTAMTALFVVLTGALIVANSVYGVQAQVSVFEGRTLVYCFLCGSMAYVWRDRLVFNTVFFIISFVACYILLLQARALYITPIFLTYFTVFIGLMPLPQYKLIKSGDYSYGIYLYSFPVTQAIVALAGPGNMSFLVLFPLVVIATCLFAAFSWHGVEKHCLKLKRFLSERSAKITEQLHPDVKADNADHAVPGLSHDSVSVPR